MYILKQTMEALNEAFENAPDEFTSYEFYKEVNRLADQWTYPQVQFYLSKLTEKVSGKVYRKKKIEGDLYAIQNAIELLKSHGYKILKRDFVEI